jgi:hypothetical protein
MTDLEIFLMTAIKNILYLHGEETQQDPCNCDQCRIARQSIKAANAHKALKEANGADEDKEST